MKAIIKHLGRPTKAQRPESQLLGSFEDNVKASCFLTMAKRNYQKQVEHLETDWFLLDERCGKKGRCEN